MSKILKKAAIFFMLSIMTFAMAMPAMAATTADDAKK